MAWKTNPTDQAEDKTYIVVDFDDLGVVTGMTKREAIAYINANCDIDDPETFVVIHGQTVIEVSPAGISFNE
jgi:hypothetical protein